jgi:GrpB-like predicted nucleotidyltransferase (UPF0157 family)
MGTSGLTGRRAVMRSERIIERYERVPVVVRRPDPAAPEVARHLLDLVARVVPGSRAEHVGSSAVPGLAGKGTIDLLLPIPSERIPAATEALLGIGFQRQSIPQTFPPSRPMLQGVFRYESRPYRVHLHLVPDSSHEVRELRGFRDALRTDERLRREYEKLKRDIVARGLTEATAFTQAKQGFIVSALRRLGLRVGDGNH